MAKNKVPQTTDTDALADHLLALHAELGEVIEHVIGTRLEGEFAHENFEEALVKLRSVRFALSDQASQLTSGGAS